MRTVTIPLDKPLTGHGGEVFRRVVVREPTFNEYLEYGDPFMVAQAPQSGIPFLLEDKPAIAAYVRLLVTEPDDPLLLEQGGMRLAQKVREAVLSFFQAGAGADGASGTSPRSSSSSSAPGSTPSGT